MTNDATTRPYRAWHYDPTDLDGIGRPAHVTTLRVDAPDVETARSEALARIPADHTLGKVQRDVDYDSHAAQAEFDRIWTGETVGFSEAMLRRDLDEHRQMLHDLNAGRLRPSKVVGRGYRNPRQVAVEWLERQIAEEDTDVASRGRTNTVNRSNVRVRLLKAEGAW